MYDTTQSGGVPCPDCDGTMRTQRGEARAVCPECDATMAPCPECSALLRVPGEHIADRGYCPDCGSNRVKPTSEGGLYKCVSCATEMDRSEYPGGTVTCGSCNSTILILADDPKQVE